MNKLKALSGILAIIAFSNGVTPEPLVCENGSPLFGGTGFCSVLLTGDNKGEVYLKGDKEDRKQTGLYGNMCIGGAYKKLKFYGNQAITGFANLEPTVDTSVDDLDNYVWDEINTQADLSQENEYARTVAETLTNLTCDVRFNEQEFKALPTTLDISQYKTTTEADQVVICLDGKVKIEQDMVFTAPVGYSVVFNVFYNKFEIKNAKVKTADGLKPKDLVWNFIDDGEVKLKGHVGGYPNCCSAELDGSIIAINRKIELNPALVHGQIISEKEIIMDGGSLVNCHSTGYFYEWPPLPSEGPSSVPSVSLEPTNKPSVSPTRSPTATPTYSPTSNPTKSSAPSAAPTETKPTSTPSASPTANPTVFVPYKMGFTLVVQLDGKPQETGLNIQCTDGSNAEIPTGVLAPDLQPAVKEILESQNVGKFDINQQQFRIESFLSEPTSCVITISDSGGDGICCGNPASPGVNGFYQIYLDGTMVEAGGAFGDVTTFEFTVTPP